MLRQQKRRTDAEIDAMIEKGEEFVRRSPESMFGDDNVRSFEIFKKFTEKFKAGASIKELNDFNEEAYGNFDTDYSNGSSAIDWLSRNSEEMY
jgi:hypothetical protein